MDKSFVNQRFIELVNYLVNSNSLKSRTELAEKLNVKFNKLSEILNGRASVGIDMIINFCEMFSVNYEYLLTGRGAIYKKSTSNTGEITPDAVIDYLILNTEKLLENRKFKVWYDNIYTKGALDSVRENVKAKYNKSGD